jgi:hypothetical protein
MWTPGANWTTTIEVDNDDELNGHPVLAGKYSVWMQPQADSWTVFLNRGWRLYHDTPVPEDHELFSFTVEPQEGALPAVERMAFVGRYRLVGNDPTTGGPLTVPLEINTEGDQLVGRWGRGQVQLIPNEAGELMIGFMRNGALFDVAPEMTLRMIEGDSRRGIELLWEGERSAKGDRLP